MRDEGFGSFKDLGGRGGRVRETPAPLLHVNGVSGGQVVHLEDHLESMGLTLALAFIQPKPHLRPSNNNLNTVNSG